MYSLINTVQSIEALCTNAVPLIQQYFYNVEVTPDHGEGYVIPSLIWPPPTLLQTFDIFTKEVDK